MAEKKIHENPLPEEHKPEPEKSKDMAVKPSDKQQSIPVVTPITNIPPQVSMPVFTKASPNDLYRRWLPAVLFLLTFVTVMTILLIYMDTVALGAHQFRVNMSRDYELARIGQDSAPLVAYVRQLHLAPRPPAVAPAAARTDRVDVLDRLLGEVHHGTFVEWFPSGARSATTRYLEAARHWSGVAVRAAPTDYLSLRGSVQALHACLSPTEHPREVTYQSGSVGDWLVSRVLCLPLYTVVLAANTSHAHYVVLAGSNVPAAITHLPVDDVGFKVIEYQTTDKAARDNTTELLLKHNYYIAANFTDSIMYALNETAVANVN